VRYLYLIVTVLFLIVFVTFTAANRHAVAIDFWPFDYQLSLPFALVLLGSLLTGFLVGSFLMWLRFGAARARARRAEQRAAVLERELTELKRMTGTQRSPAAGGAAQSALPASGLKAVSGGR
jgi:uncharacterized integral membrane protein